MLHIFLLAIVIQLLSVIGVFAPNALSVMPAERRNSTLSVPSPALQSIHPTASSYFLESRSSCANATLDTTECDRLYLYADPSPVFQRLARGVMDSSTILPWGPPSDCGRECAYNVTYWGPALKCTTIPQSSIGVLGMDITNTTGANATVNPAIAVSDPTYFLRGGYVYNSTTTFMNGTSWNSKLTSSIRHTLRMVHHRFLSTPSTPRILSPCHSTLRIRSTTT